MNFKSYHHPILFSGILFFMANIASSALNAVACTEGLLSSFGPGGAVMDLLPGGRWWEVGQMEYLGKVLTFNSSDSLLFCTEHP